MKRLLTIGLFAGLLGGGAAYAAQQTWRIHWDCRGSSGCIGAWGRNEGTTGAFSTRAECEDFIAMQPQYGSRRNGYPLNTWCEPGAGDGSGGGERRREKVSMPDALWQLYLIGCVSGATMGSFLGEGETGHKPILPLCYNWGGWTLGVVTLINVNKMPAAGFGLSIGAATTSAFVGFEQYRNWKGRSDGSFKEQKDILKQGILFGALAGGGAYALRKVSTHATASPVVRVLSRLNIFVIGRGVGGAVRW